MAYERRKTKSDAAYQKLKADLASGTPGNAYVFFGEESYLREYYLRRLRKTLIPAGSEEFNDHVLDGRSLTVQELSEAAEAMPMMSERTLTTVSDYDLFRLPQEQREKLIALLEDLPPYCCIVFIYDTVAYKPNRTMKKLCAAMEKYVQAVEFRAADHGDLVEWIRRRFQALDREIDRQTAEYLIFTCGGLMTGLVPEITKIGTYARGKTITVKEIDAVADPVLSAEVLRLTDAVLKGDREESARLLGELLKMQTDPILITAALGSQMRRIYTARLAIDHGKDRTWLMDLWSQKSDYPVKLWLRAAARATREWCADAVRRCQVLDRRLKSERGIDGTGELKLLLVELEAGAR